MKHTNENLTRLPNLNKGDVFVDCTFSGVKAGIVSGEGAQNLRFERCRINGRELPEIAWLDEKWLNAQLTAWATPEPTPEELAEEAEAAERIRASFDDEIAVAIDAEMARIRQARNPRGVVR